MRLTGSVRGSILHLPACSRALCRGDQKQSLSQSLSRKAERNKSQLIEFLGPFLIRGLCTLLEPGGFLRTGPGSFSWGARVKNMASTIRPSGFVSALRSWVVWGKWHSSSVPRCPCCHLQTRVVTDDMSDAVDLKREPPSCRVLGT